LQDRIFYQNSELGWFAFLSAPPHTIGHTILAAIERGGSCPQEFDPETLHGLGTVLCDVVQAIRECYAPHIKDILFASLRGDIKHFHLHLLPLWPEEEKRWREVTGYCDSHLMEFIGSLEKKQNFLVLERAAKKGKSEELQRLDSTTELSGEIQALRRITGYPPRA
jgi:diadenosine tetraphosphate (Ap4A) HIT family hydrolase